MHLTADDPRTVAGEPLCRILLLGLGFLCLALTFVFIAVARGPELSPVDEPTHADYAYQISHGTIPARGSLISSEIQYEGACHTLEASTAHPDCAAAVSTSQPATQNYNFGEAPLYYLVTGEVDRGLDAVFPGTHDFITLGRCIGAGWLFSGMLVLYLALRRFEVDWPFAAAAAVLVPLCPGVLAASSTMTNDAPAALAGASALYLLARLMTQERTGWVAPAVVTALATATKVLNGMPMLAVAGIAAVIAVARWRRGTSPEAYRAAACCLAILVAFGAVYLGWAMFQAGRGPSDWVNPNLADGLPLTGSPSGDMLSNLFGGFQHLATNYWLQPDINGETVSIWATALGVLFAAAPLLALAADRAARRPGPWAWPPSAA